jgi:hypothetical protein
MAQTGVTAGPINEYQQIRRRFSSHAPIIIVTTPQQKPRQNG